MAKYAQVPSGELLEFPDETPDSVVDRSVREFMGLPEPIDPVEVQVMAAQASVAAAERVAASVQELIANMQQLSQMSEARQADTAQASVEGLQALADQVQAQVQVQAEASAKGIITQMQALQSLVASLETRMDNLLQAYTAPRKLLHDANGKPYGVTLQLPGKGE